MLPWQPTQPPTLSRTGNEYQPKISGWNRQRVTLLGNVINGIAAEPNSYRYYSLQFLVLCVR